MTRFSFKTSKQVVGKILIVLGNKQFPLRN
jgi:hypothetical protein